MGKRKGSTKTLQPLLIRDPETFSKVKADIESLGVSSIAKHSGLSSTTVYSFLKGDGISPMAENELQRGLSGARQAQQNLTKGWV